MPKIKETLRSISFYKIALSSPSPLLSEAWALPYEPEANILSEA
jgi:hypothetical protein